MNTEMQETIRELRHASNLYEQAERLEKEIERIPEKHEREEELKLLEAEIGKGKEKRLERLAGFAQEAHKDVEAHRPSADLGSFAPPPIFDPYELCNKKRLAIGIVSALLILPSILMYLISTICESDAGVFIFMLLSLGSFFVWLFMGKGAIDDGIQLQKQMGSYNQYWKTEFAKGKDDETRAALFREFEVFEGAFHAFVESCDREVRKEKQALDKEVKQIKAESKAAAEAETNAVTAQLGEVNAELRKITFLDPIYYRAAGRAADKLRFGDADNLSDALHDAFDEALAEDRARLEAEQQREKERREAQEQKEREEADIRRVIAERCTDCVNWYKCSNDAKRHARSCSAFRPR